jgi:hypothetical protein
VAGACLIVSAISGRPEVLYRLFDQLGNPRGEVLLVGLGVLAAAALHGRASRWGWVRAVLGAIDAGPPRQAHHRVLVVAWSAALVVVALGLAATLWWEPGGGRALTYQARLRAEDGVWETLGAVALLGAGGLLVYAGLMRDRGSAPRRMLVCLGVLLVVGGAEEVSWGQRLFGFATPQVFRAVNVQAEVNVHNVGGYWANYLLMLGFFFYVGLLPLLERTFADVRGVVTAVGLPVPPLAFAPFGLIGAFLGDHPLLTALWPPSSWRLSEARETLFSLVMLGVALDRWLLARRLPSALPTRE